MNFISDNAKKIRVCFIGWKGLKISDSPCICMNSMNAYLMCSTSERHLNDEMFSTRIYKLIIV